MQQGLAQLVFHMQVGGRREDEVSDLVAFVSERVDHVHRGVDVTRGRAHHADDLEVGPDLAALAAFEDEPQRLAFALGDRWKADVHDVDSDVRQHPGELVLVLRRDRDTGHLLAVAKRVVIDANLVVGRKDQVMPKVLWIPRQLLERLLQLDRLAVH